MGYSYSHEVLNESQLHDDDGGIVRVPIRFNLINAKITRGLPKKDHLRLPQQTQES